MNLNIIKRILAKSGLKQAEKEAVEDAFKVSPKAVYDDLTKANPKIVKEAELEEVFQTQYHPTGPIKSAKDSAEVLAGKPDTDFVLGDSSPVISGRTDFQLGEAGRVSTPKDFPSTRVKGPGTDLVPTEAPLVSGLPETIPGRSAVRPDIETTATLLDDGANKALVPVNATPIPPKGDFNDYLKKLALLPKNHPLLAGAAGLGAYGVYNATNKPEESKDGDGFVEKPVERKPNNPGKGGIKPASKPAGEPEPSLDLSKASVEQSNFTDMLSRLMQNRDQLNLMGGLGKVGETIGTAISGAKPVATESFNDIQKMGEKPLADFNQKLEMRKFDPASEISKSYRDFAKQIGVKVSEKATAADLEKLTPLMERYMQAKDAAAARKQQMVLANRDKETLEREKFIERSRNQVNKLENVAVFDGMNNALNEINRFIANPDPVASSSLSYTFAKINDPKTGVRDHELRLLGLSGDAISRLKQTFSQFANGTITRDKALEFKGLIEDKLADQKKIVRSKLDGFKTQADRRYGPDAFKEVVGDNLYKNIYDEPNTDFSDLGFKPNKK